MDKLQFEHTGGPYGDASSRYNISFPEGMNLGEFIKTVLHECPDEWGDFRLDWNGAPLVEYRAGNLYNVSKELSINLAKEVIKATGHGGWSNMDYVLELKDPEPQIDAIRTYDQNEYWGYWLICQKCGSKYTPSYGKYCCECGHRFETKHDETREEWNERYQKEMKIL